MGKIETATQWMIDLANDDSHGYDQDSRWGPDYDCSSSVISAWQYAGVPVKTQRCFFHIRYENVFLSCGFTNVISSVNVSTGAGLKRGDVYIEGDILLCTSEITSRLPLILMKREPPKVENRRSDWKGNSVSAYSNSSSNLWTVVLLVTQPKLKRLLLSQPQRPANGFREVMANGGIDILTVLVRKVTGN